MLTSVLALALATTTAAAAAAAASASPSATRTSALGLATAGCLDLARDCGAKGDGQTDDTAAFAVCQSKIETARLGSAAVARL